MALYNVEIFDGRKYRSSAQIEEIEYKEDYLSPEKNKIKTGMKGFFAEKGDYIRVRGPDVNQMGIVTGYEDAKTEKTVTYESILTMFDAEIFCSPDELQEKTVEAYIAGLIEMYYINNPDAAQNVDGLSVSVLTATYGYLEMENICNLLDDIIIPAFSTYQIVITPIWNLSDGTIEMQIARVDIDDKVIEADLPNVLSKSIVLKKTKNDLNKVIVLNEENIAEYLEVYRTLDNEITTENKNRITPVVFEVIAAKAGKNKTFSETAMEKAESKLKKAEYENLIELETLIGDSLVSPGDIRIGQRVRIITGRMEYVSILTGRKIKGTEELIFGTIRLELTKTIRR